MNWFLKNIKYNRKSKNILLKLLLLVIGTKPRYHRIPLGPIKGKVIYMSPLTSIRMYLGIDEPFICKAAKYINEDDTVYDIGAHIGYTSLLFAQTLKGSGEVHAFEILPSTANNFLKKTINANEFDNIFLHNVGLGKEFSAMELTVGSTLMTSTCYKVKGENKEHCKVYSLDEYVNKTKMQEPSFIKVDIERAEIDFIKGAESIIKNCRPKMVIEFHSLDLLIEGYQMLSKLGYALEMENGKITSSYLRTLKHFHQSVICLPTD